MSDESIVRGVMNIVIHKDILDIHDPQWLATKVIKPENILEPLPVRCNSKEAAIRAVAEYIIEQLNA